MSIAAILDTGMTAATSAAAAAASFTSNLTAISALAQSSTNGASELGTIDAANLPTTWLPQVRYRR